MPTFRLDAPVVIRAKVEEVRNNVAIYSHTLLRILKVVLRADDPSGPIMETSHHCSLHVGRMMGFEVEIPVCMRGLPVDGDI